MFGFFTKAATPPVTTCHLQIPNTLFNYTIPSHLELIDVHVAKFNTSLHALQQLDCNILISLAIGSACYVGTYILPLVSLTIVGFCMATHYYAKRTEAYKQYRNALTELIKVYQWSMGKETGEHWHKLAVPNLQQLIITLGPWVSKETIYTWSLQDLKPASLSLGSLMGHRRSDLTESFEQTLHRLATGTQAADYLYRLYGEYGIEDILDTLRVKAATQLTRLASKVFTSAQNTLSPN